MHTGFQILPILQTIESYQGRALPLLHSATMPLADPATHGRCNLWLLCRMHPACCLCLWVHDLHPWASYHDTSLDHHLCFSLGSNPAAAAFWQHISCQEFNHCSGMNSLHIRIFLLLPASLQAVAAVQDASGRLSLFWVHDLHAGSQSLEQVHLQPREGPGGLMQSNPATPPELWSYLVQVC